MDEQHFLETRGADVDIGFQELQYSPVRNVDDRILEAESGLLCWSHRFCTGTYV